MKFIYSKEHLSFLREHYPSMMYPELTVAFNKRFGLEKTPIAIKACLSNHGIKAGRGAGVIPGVRRMLTDAQHEFVKVLYSHHSLKETTQALNNRFDTSFTSEQIKRYVTTHGILSGRTGRFESGIKPWNTGTKGVMKANRTSFKKGDIPKSRKPMGHERICPKDGYILVKVAERNPHTGFWGWYRHKHVVEWEKVNGPVPEGHVIKFLDDDKTNCDPDNLILLSRAELCWLNKNGYGELPEELKPTFRALAKLISATHAAGRKGAIA